MLTIVYELSSCRLCVEIDLQNSDNYKTDFKFISKSAYKELNFISFRHIDHLDNSYNVFFIKASIKCASSLQ
jgi:hypothetical protein